MLGPLAERRPNRAVRGCPGLTGDLSGGDPSRFTVLNCRDADGLTAPGTGDGPRRVRRARIAERHPPDRVRGIADRDRGRNASHSGGRRHHLAGRHEHCAAGSHGGCDPEPGRDTDPDPDPDPDPDRRRVGVAAAGRHDLAVAVDRPAR